MWGLFADNLLPMFLVAGAGWLLRSAVRCDPRPLAQLAFYVFAPCLVFDLITHNELGGGDLARMAGMAVLAQTLPAAVAWFVAGRLGWSRPLTSAVVLAVLMPNAGNFGLSASLFAFGDEALSHATVFFVTSALITFSLGVFVASLGRVGWRQAAAGMLRVPPVWALLLGLMFKFMGWSLPFPFERSVALLSDASIPTMLVVLGVQLHGFGLRGPYGPVAWGVSLRLLGGVAAGVAVAAFLGLDGAARQAGILQAGMPSAVITIVMAIQYDTEPAVVTTIVCVGTILSPLTLTPLLAWLGG